LTQEKSGQADSPLDLVDKGSGDSSIDVGQAAFSLSFFCSCRSDGGSDREKCAKGATGNSYQEDMLSA